MTERDTHFAGYADLLFPELTGLFYQLYTFRHADEHSAAEQIIYLIKEHLAQRAYDLACHVLEHAKGDIIDNVEFYVKWNIPDLTQWPTEVEQPTAE